MTTGRDPSKNNNDRKLETFGQKENDIIFKYDLTERSTHAAIRENTISLFTKEGKVGITINGDKGNTKCQGKAEFTASGKSIVKGMYTENPMGFLDQTMIGGYPPHTHSYQAAYLFNMPNMSMLTSIKKKFSSFIKLFG